jgi:hypothetical protein
MRLLPLALVALVLLLPAAASAKSTNCGDYSTSLADAKLTVKDVTVTGIGCTSAKRLVRQCISMVGPSPAWKLSQKGNRITMVNGRRKIAFTLTRNSGDCVGS